jgi:hypothetical protein
MKERWQWNGWLVKIDVGNSGGAGTGSECAPRDAVGSIGAIVGSAEDDKSYRLNKRGRQGL